MRFLKLFHIRLRHLNSRHWRYFNHFTCQCLDWVNYFDFKEVRLGKIKWPYMRTRWYLDLEQGCKQNLVQLIIELHSFLEREFQRFLKLEDCISSWNLLAALLSFGASWSVWSLSACLPPLHSKRSQSLSTTF